MSDISAVFTLLLYLSLLLECIRKWILTLILFILVFFLNKYFKIKLICIVLDYKCFIFLYSKYTEFRWPACFPFY